MAVLSGREAFVVVVAVVKDLYKLTVVILSATTRHCSLLGVFELFTSFGSSTENLLRRMELWLMGRQAQRSQAMRGVARIGFGV